MIIIIIDVEEFEYIFIKQCTIVIYDIKFIKCINEWS